MLNYTLSNICGCFYTGGKILFSNDGNSLFVPVSNRINIYDLSNNSCNTLKSESRNDIRHITIHPSMEIIITIDKFGYGCVINLLKDQIISRILFKSKTGVVTSFNYNNMLTPQEEQDVVNSAMFTNSGKYFLITVGRRVVIWKSPCKQNNYKLIKYNDICFHSLNVISIDISTDDKYFLTTSYDMTIRIHTVKKEKKIKPTILGGNKTTIVGAFFSKNGNFIFSVNKSGLIIIWSYEAQTGVDEKCENFEAEKVYEDVSRDDNKGDEDVSMDDNKGDEDVSRDDNKSDEDVSRDDENISSDNEKKKNRKEEKWSKICAHDNKIKDNTNKNKNNNHHNNNNNNNDYFNSSVKRAFEKRWRYKRIYYCNQEKNEEVIRSCFNKEKDIFVIAFSSGRFGIYSTPDMISLYNISINTNTIDDITINTDGEWIALGEGNNGTIIIWEWKSESYILKQNTTNKNVKCVRFSPIISHLKIGSHIIDNSSTYHESDNFTSKFVIVTGNEDGTIKLYDYLSFINFVTFTAHTNTVTDICFLPQGNAFISCSLDGTVRAFDLLRYRNFKIYTPDVITDLNHYSNNMNDLNSSGKKKVDKKLNVQFLCVGVNISGNIVAAGGRGNEYVVYIWNVQTGKCIDKLFGHNSPIIKICFSTNLKNEGVIASCSWSKNVLIWDLYARQNKGSKYEEITTSHDISYMCFDPRGNDILAVCTLSCKIMFWDISIQEVVGTIEGARDIKRGRLLGEQFGAIPKMNKKRNRKKSLNNVDEESMYEEDLEDQGNNTIVNQNCYFTSIDYIHNGNYIVGCANCSVSLYIYDTNLYLLIKIIDLTKNYCVDGIKREISTRYLTSEGTHIYELDISDEEGDIYLDNYKIMNRKKKQNLLPGQINEDYLNSKLKKYKFLLNQLHISGDDRHIAVACNTGLYVFTKDYQYQYIPSIKNIYKGLISPNIYVPKFLTQNVNLNNLKNSLKKKEYMKAFILSLALNNYENILEVYENIPYNIIPLCVKVLTKPFLFILINFIKTLLINDTIKHIHLHLFYLNSLFTTHFNVFLNNDFYNHMNNNKSIKNSQDKIKTSTQNVMSNTSSLFSSDEIRTSLLLILKQIFTINNGLQYLYSNNINVLKYLSLKE
ncbi:periodic tryptophan protein 2 [Plasmodium falciparum NF54]|uniref:Periodic tryptophan protein 2, putative n=2 Tax=Plasmodium falciparum TaxID=5833 RepID=Q8IAM3_PLAF7|nr:periodic tryptophan protein 2, putative [Plasmodium falciparum 3D7]KAF4330209.1 periodic tryptophan protein 2 [Plasmodium falciparum NF54]PKC47412.1 periodic tryptophan protein 2 [Plasmodium falciparum NF54]CAD51340.1 periodic tryptophan protein 2, putative [Plasmodium falciparum 3D7]|eukprot:XP_001349491.1 periodic tryptophan protein 2, putative [Plasmodium falciparum 3D7]